MSFRISIPQFEGPYELLVYLIENADMSIYDIRISEITNQYIDAVNSMDDSDVDKMTDFMVLSAELLRIKSEMLVRSQVEPEKVELEEDPRENLVEQIIEYKKCRRAVEMLEKRHSEVDQVFTKPQEDFSVYKEGQEERLIIEPKRMCRMLVAFVKRKEKIESTRRRYSVLPKEWETLDYRIDKLREQLMDAGGKRFDFREILPPNPRLADIVLGFLAVLHLVSKGALDVEQKYRHGSIKVWKMMDSSTWEEGDN